MEVMFLRVLITLITIIKTIHSQSGNPNCRTLTGALSGTGDDDVSQTQCSADEVMTSCLSFGENDIDGGKRDGERIQFEEDGAVVCRTFNGREGKGVRAYARCCRWTNMECSYPFTPSSISDINTYYVNEVTCPRETVAVGCMAHSDFSCIKGASPAISAITLLTVNSGVDQEINNNACRGYSCRSVTPTAACCKAPGLECHVRISSKSALATVNCNLGWVMTGCNVHSSNDTSSIPMGSKIENNVCSAYGTGGEGIWAVAVCCRTVLTTTSSSHVTTGSIAPTVLSLTTNLSSGLSPTPRMSCDSLSSPTNARTVGGTLTVYYSGDSIIFECHDGYEQSSGNRQRTCESSGSWSGTELECTKTGVYVPQYALYIAGGALLVVIICFTCFICYKRSQQKKQIPEDIYITSGSSVSSHQSSVFRSPIYEELPQFKLVKSKTMPSRPPRVPHRSPSCNVDGSNKNLKVPMARSMTRPHSLPPDPNKQNNMYKKYNSRSKPKSHLYDVPPIEVHFESDYELPKSDPPPPPPPDTKRPTSRQSLSPESNTRLLSAHSDAPDNRPIPAIRTIPPRSISVHETKSETHPSTSTTANGSIVNGFANPAFVPSPTDDSSDLMNRHLNGNVQVSEL